MALNIAVPLTGVGGISPVSPIGLVDCWDNVKILASPIGSESSGVSSLDSDELKGQQCLLNLNHHQSQQEPLQQQAFTLDLKSTSQTIVTKNSNQNFSNINNINLNNINNINYINNINHINNNNNNALYVNVNNNNNQKKVIIVKKPQDLKIMYNGRDILDLGKNIETNTKLWNLKYTYLPENNNIPMFLANRSQYHRLGANGHIQEYTLYHCDHCDYQFPVMINTANYMAQTSLNVTLTSNSSSALYTNSSINKSGISVPNTNLTNSTSTITSINTNGGIIGNSGTIDSKQDKPINNKNISLHNNSKPVKRVQLTKEELNECDFSYTLKKVLIDYNNSLNNGMQNFPIKCNNNVNNNNNNGIISNNQIPSIFSHSVAAVAAAAALSPQLSSQATSPSCCSSSGYSSNGSTHSLFSGGNNGIKYPVAAMAPNCNNNNNHNNNINNMNVQNNYNKNNVMPFQQQQQQAKLNYNKSPTGGIMNNNTNNNNNSIYSLLNSLNNNMNGNGNNNGNCNNIYGNNYWNNNNNNTNGGGLSYGANNNISNQMNIHNPNLNNNSANNQNFARMYKYF